jgi:hypothetical protein
VHFLASIGKPVCSGDGSEKRGTGILGELGRQHRRAEVHATGMRHAKPQECAPTTKQVLYGACILPVYGMTAVVTLSIGLRRARHQRSAWA